MQILVDADACPVVIRDILYRASQKRAIKLTLFANQSLRIPASPMITPRGERYTENNIRQRLQMRDFMETMRASGEHAGGPAPLNHNDRKKFADQLDRLLSEALKSRRPAI